MRFNAASARAVVSCSVYCSDLGILTMVRNLKKQITVAMYDQSKNFYMAVGHGISHWSRMEECLVQVVARLLRTSEAKAGLVMYSIMSFHAWITIIDELFELDGTYKNSLQAWRKLMESLKTENDIRVRLAHHSISQEMKRVPTRGQDNQFSLQIQAYLRPGKLDTRTKTAKLTFRPLTKSEIEDFADRVEDIHEKLILLLALMRKQKSLR